MVDYVSLVVSIISFIGAVLAAGVTAWVNYYSDERARLSETDKIVDKYRDPLFLAAHDLQCTLYDIVDEPNPHYIDPHTKTPREVSMLYTCFAVGQFFSWSHILHRHAQFLSFSTDKHNKKLVQTLYKIQKEFGNGDYGAPFILWRCQQMGIGEEMTTEGDGKDTEVFCKGYTTFKKRWKEEGNFCDWFSPIKAGFIDLAAHSKDNSSALKQHIQRLQHLLLELMVILNTRQSFKKFHVEICRDPPNCPCNKCPHPSRRRLEV